MACYRERAGRNGQPRNDATLMLDEIREVDGREAGNIAYMLANGQGKARARTDGSVRETNRWNLLFLSTGELSLVEHAANAGERTYAGVEVRMIQIPSDSGKHGVLRSCTALVVVKRWRSIWNTPLFIIMAHPSATGCIV